MRGIAQRLIPALLDDRLPGLNREADVRVKRAVRKAQVGERLAPFVRDLDRRHARSRAAVAPSGEQALLGTICLRLLGVDQHRSAKRALDKPRLEHKLRAVAARVARGCDHRSPRDRIPRWMVEGRSTATPKVVIQLVKLHWSLAPRCRVLADTIELVATSPSPLTNPPFGAGPANPVSAPGMPAWRARTGRHARRFLLRRPRAHVREAQRCQFQRRPAPVEPAHPLRSTEPASLSEPV